MQIRTSFDSRLIQTWDRDVSAARNILRCLLARADGVDRPTALRRNKKPPRDPLQAELAEEAAADY